MNEILLSITNRRTFNHSALYTPPGPDMAPLPATQERLRQLLGLHDTTTDYYVVGALGSILACPDVEEAFAEKGRTYELGLWTPPAPVFEGGDLVPDLSGPPRMWSPAPPADAPLGIEITFGDVNNAVVAYDGKRAIVPARWDGQRLFVQWPADLGLAGAILSEQIWDADYQVTITRTPRSYNHAAVIERLKTFPELIDLLVSKDLVVAYHKAQTRVEKVAVACLALGLNNPNVYG